MAKRLVRLFVLAVLSAAGCDKGQDDKGEANKASAEAKAADDGGDKDGDAKTESADKGIAAVAEKAATDAKTKSSPEVEAQITKAIDALGGAATIQALESFHSVAKLEIKGQGMSAKVETWWKQGDFYIESEMTGVGTTKAWKHGADTWSEDPISGKRKLEGREAEQAAWGASVSLLVEHSRFFESAVLGETRKDGETEVVDILFTTPGGAEVTVSLDTETNLPFSQSFKQASPMGDTPVTTYFEDYREVAGIQTPFRTRTSLSIVEAVTTTETWEPNVPVDDSKFVPPA